jgi:hypothetical protein
MRTHGIRYAAVLVGLMMDPAHADRLRPGVLASFGVRRTWDVDDALFRSPATEPLHPAVSVTPTLSISEHLGLGVRIAAARATYRLGETDCYHLISIDYGPAIQYRDTWFSIGAWIGRHRSRVSNGVEGFTCSDLFENAPVWTENFTSYGVTASFDVWRHDPHRIAVVLDAQTSTGGGELSGGRQQDGPLTYSAITLGVGYRY